MTDPIVTLRNLDLAMCAAFMLRQNNAGIKPRRFVTECGTSTEAKTSRLYEFSLAEGLI